MCGLTALFIKNKNTNLQLRYLEKFKQLAKLSGERGQDSSGIFLVYKNNFDKNVVGLTIKSDGGILYTLNSNKFKEFEDSLLAGTLTLILAISHTRMATVGNSLDNQENQPLVSRDKVVFFNGIVNDNLISGKVNRDLYTLNDQVNDGWFYTDLNLIEVDSDYGICNIIRFDKNSGLLEVITNNGDLFKCEPDLDSLFISSDNRFLDKVFKDKNIFQFQKNVLNKYQVDYLDIVASYQVQTPLSPVSNDNNSIIDNLLWNDILEIIKNKSSYVHKCNVCGTPEVKTNQFTCVKCVSYEPKIYLGEEKFTKLIGDLNSKDGNFLLGLSGGRDSSYVLAELIATWKVKNLVTYTFDWGVNTPYARHNVSRMCSHFGVRNILVAADIRKKRKNVRSVLSAYCHNPVPGLIPMLMAGDKQFISTAKKLSKQLNSNLEIFGFNPFEKTRFKEELIAANLWPDNDDGMFGEDLSLSSQLKLVLGYASKIVSNPAYWGSSLFDAAKGFINYYHSGVSRTNYFDFFEWNEEVVDTRLESLGWVRPAFRSSWRIGDGTSSFYNLAYLLHQGWCENNVLRSNQVRSGHFSLNHGFDLVNNDNIPDKQMLEWYFGVLDLNPNQMLTMLLKKYD